jgi:hypothetical protein
MIDLTRDGNSKNGGIDRLFAGIQRDRYMGDKGISEKFSEKRKRGRPRLLHPDLREVYAQDQQYASERMIQNTSYYIRAFACLVDEPWAEWLIGYTSQEGKPGKIRKTILAELGRLDDDTELVMMARAICAGHPNTRDALARIRQFRLGCMRVSSISQLTEVLRRTVNTYLCEHADFSLADAQLAVADLFQLIGKRVNNT